MKDIGIRVTVGVALGAVVALIVATPSAPPQTVTVLLAGDVMMGREVAPIAAGDPEGLFQDIRATLRGPDLAMANLESPLTDLLHVSPNPHALEGDPATADLLASAGFDLINLANNHSGDAGPAGLLDTTRAIEEAGMDVVGAGFDSSRAREPVFKEFGELRVAVLAFDATGAGLAAGVEPGVAMWDTATAREAVTGAAKLADVVIVSVHGGVEYLPESDPRMIAIGEMLASWGADVVWGHGAHVVQPLTTLPAESGRTTIVATSLGNFLFDQRGALTGEGAVLEVMADPEGVIAYRLGSTSHRDLRVHFETWEAPTGDAVLVDGEWWNLLRGFEPRAETPAPVTAFPWGEVVAASTGRVTSQDRLETVISFRQPARPHPVREGLPHIDWTDHAGRTAHLGIYRADDLAPIWVAGMVPSPVAAVRACDGSIAMAYSSLDDPSILATGAAVWSTFGLDAAATLPGPGIPACCDVDRDGLTEPAILERE